MSKILIKMQHKILSVPIPYKEKEEPLAALFLKMRHHGVVRPSCLGRSNVTTTKKLMKEFGPSTELLKSLMPDEKEKFELDLLILFRSIKMVSYKEPTETSGFQTVCSNLQKIEKKYKSNTTINGYLSSLRHKILVGLMVAYPREAQVQIEEMLKNPQSDQVQPLSAGLCRWYVWHISSKKTQQEIVAFARKIKTPTENLPYLLYQKAFEKELPRAGTNLFWEYAHLAAHHQDALCCTRLADHCRKHFIPKAAPKTVDSTTTQSAGGSASQEDPEKDRIIVLRNESIDAKEMLRNQRLSDELAVHKRHCILEYLNQYADQPEAFCEKIAELYEFVIEDSTLKDTFIITFIPKLNPDLVRLIGLIKRLFELPLDHNESAEAWENTDASGISLQETRRVLRTQKAGATRELTAREEDCIAHYEPLVKKIEIVETERAAQAARSTPKPPLERRPVVIQPASSSSSTGGTRITDEALTRELIGGIREKGIPFLVRRLYVQIQGDPTSEM
ncbi:MAG: hypothetical protein AB7F28_04880 [Candidatus Margulisiibacteriota bacterium]